MTTSPRRSANRPDVYVGAAAVLALFASGLVIATSWVWRYPGAVELGAWLVALGAIIVVVVSAFRESRRTGDGLHRAIGRSLRALGQFVFWYF